MLSWGPWLLFAVGVLMILAAIPFDAGSVTRDVASGARVEGADVVVTWDVGGAEQLRYVREVVAGEILIVAGSLLMIAGAALPRLGRSPADGMRSYEAEGSSNSID